MAVDGTWNITMQTPMGERASTVTLTSAGGSLSGTQGADGNSTEIFDGSVARLRPPTRPLARLARADLRRQSACLRIADVP
jgi:hypothetical protein